jgi:predicted nucleotidyltransferase
MIPTLDRIIKCSKIHPSRVFNVYIFGSRLYGTSSEESDWDIIMIAKNSVEALEIKSDELNIHIYTPDKFISDLKWHRINNLECIFSPDWAKLKEDIKFDTFKIDLIKLRHASSHLSISSWIKSKNKIESGEYYSGLKSLFHSLRILIFSIQIVKDKKITDYESANSIWEIIKNKYLLSDDWCYYSDLPSVHSYKKIKFSDLDSDFSELKNKLSHDFIKLVKINSN